MTLGIDTHVYSRCSVLISEDPSPCDRVDELMEEGMERGTEEGKEGEREGREREERMGGGGINVPKAEPCT